MIETWSTGVADDSMSEDLLVELSDTVRRHPWWVARANLALTLLRQNSVRPPAHVLDVGCGWGTNLVALENAGYRVSGLDISRRALERIDKAERHLIEADLSQDLPADRPLADAVLALDVIEHIDNDTAALTRIATLVRPGGVAIVSVPALPELFSNFDAVQQHRRRYLPHSFRAVFEGSGLLVRSVFWWGAWMVPVLRRMRLRESKAIQATRSYSDYLRLPPWPGPYLMTLAFALEKPFAVRQWLRTGTSLIAVASRAA
jgi:SAM-dependent methyltransferase